MVWRSQDPHPIRLPSPQLPSAWGSDGPARALQDKQSSIHSQRRDKSLSSCPAPCKGRLTRGPELSLTMLGDPDAVNRMRIFGSASLFSLSGRHEDRMGCRAGCGGGRGKGSLCDLNFQTLWKESCPQGARRANSITPSPMTRTPLNSDLIFQAREGTQ